MQTTYLIIRFSSLGDIILTSPVVLNLKIAEPSCRIMYLTKERFKAVVAMIPGVDEIVALPDASSNAQLFKLLRDIDRKRIDTIIDLHGNLRSWFSRKAVSAKRVSIYPKRRYERWRAVKFKPNKGPYTHTIDMYSTTLRRIGVPTPSFRPLLSVPDNMNRRVTFDDDSKPLVVLAPGAAHRNKKWPVDNFARTAETVHKETDANIVWAITSREESSDDPIPDIGAGSFIRLVDSPIDELAALISDADLTIANDSGIAHLSSAVGTPVVAVFGPTHPVLGFVPRGLRDRVVEVDEFCRPCSLHGAKPCYRQEQYCFTRITPGRVSGLAVSMITEAQSRKPALFVDRDGTLIVNKHYLSDPAGVELIPGGAKALKQVQERGWKVVIISNQSGVARGLMTENDVRAVNERVNELLAAEGVTVDGFYYCPHHPQEGDNPVYHKECDCRKPSPGMAEQAALELNLELRRSMVIGDSESDVYLGRVIGGRSVLVRTGYGREVERSWEAGGISPLCPVYDDLPSALDNLRLDSL